MANLLCIETSGKACSVALFQNTDLKSFKQILNEDFKHAEALHALAEVCVKEGGTGFAQLDAVAVSSGPGSYTGLRVGVSAAKGLCYGLGIPLISVNTLRLIAAQGLEKSGAPVKKVVAMTDARREEVYMQEFDTKLNVLGPARAVVLTDEHFDFSHTLFCGDGSEKAKKYFTGEGLVFFPEAIAHACYMGSESAAAFAGKKFEDTAYFEPFYLKEFYTKGQ